jgi:hypothetical protein
MAQGRIAGFENVDPALEGALAGAKRARDRAAEAVRRFASEHLDEALAGAKRARDRAAEAVRRFASEHLDDLAAERLRESEAVARRAHEALQAAESAAIAWRAEQGAWGAILREAGREDLLDDLPEDPFRGPAASGNRGAVARARGTSRRGRLRTRPSGLARGRKLSVPFGDRDKSLIGPSNLAFLCESPSEIRCLTRRDPHRARGCGDREARGGPDERQKLPLTRATRSTTTRRSPKG